MATTSSETPAEASVAGPGWFERAANAVSTACGRPTATALAVALVVGWGLVGPIFHFSDTWQLFINTGTTVLTFLMVFILQSSLNRGTLAIQLKLDELLRASAEAQNTIVGSEELSEKAIRKLEEREREEALESPS